MLYLMMIFLYNRISQFSFLKQLSFTSALPSMIDEPCRVGLFKVRYCRNERGK
jgi:hypothetical protein